MTIEKINYQKTFNLGNYSSERIGVDINLTKGDDPIKALDEAKKLVEQYHKENNPVLYGEYSNPVVHPATLTSQPIEVKQNEPRNRLGQIIDDINSCSDVKILESYKLIAKNNPVLQVAYDQKLKQLQGE